MAKIKQVVVNNFSYPFSGSNYLSINSNGVINVNAAEIYGTTYDGKYLISLSYLTDYVDAALASITPGGGGGETTNWLSSDSITPNYTTQKLNVNKQWVISTVLKDGDWNNISVSNQSKLSSMISSWGFRTSTTDSDTLYGVTVNGGILLSGQTNSTRQFYIDTEWLDTQFNTNVSGLVKSYLLSVDTPHTAGEVLKINANNDGFEWGTAGISEVNLSDVASDASAGSVIVVGSNGKLTASNDIYPLSTVASIYDIVKQIIKIDTANSHAGFTLDPNATAHTLTFTDTGDGSGSSGGGQQYTSLDTKVITVNNNSFKIGITAGSAAGQILSTMNNGGTLSAVWGTPNFLTAGDLYSSTKKLDASSISSATKPGYFKFDSDGNASIVNETYLTTDGLTQANIYDAVAAIIQKGTSHGGFDITKNPTAKTITITDAGDGSGGGGKTEDNVSTSGTTTTIGVKTDWLNGQILSYLSTLTHSSTNNTLKINDSNVVYWGQDYGGTGGDGNTTYTIVAGNSTGTKAVTNNGNSYITVKGSDGNNTQFVISGTQNVSVATDENGNVTITGPNLADYFSTVSDFIDLTNKGYLIKVNSAGTGLDYVNYSTWKLTDTNSTYSAADTSLTFNPASQTAGSNTTIKVSEAWLTGKISSYLSGLDGAAAGQVLKINDNNNGFVWATVTQGGGADGNDWYKYSAADTSLTFNPTGSTNKGTTTIAVNTTWLAGWLNDNGYAVTNDHMSTYMYANTDWNGTGTPINSSTDVSDPYIFLVEKYGSTNTKTNSIQIKAGTDISVKAKNGVITIGFTNGSGYQTTNTQYNLLVDKSQTTNGNVYIRLKDTAAAATTYVNSYKISGAQNVKVTSDSDGNITITGPDLTNYKTEDHDHTYSNGDTSLTFTPGSNETATVIVNTTWLEGFLTDNNYTINSDISGLVKEYLSGITGHAANKILKINSSNNDFEWVTPDSGGDITSTYLLSNVTGKGAGKVLKINSSNNGLVWANDEVGQSGSSDGNTTYSNGTGITLTGADADIDFGGNFSINTEWLDTYLNGKNYLTDHWVHYLRVNQGGANTIVGQQTSNTNTYLRLIENGSPVADKIQLSGGGTVSVSATSAGVITLSGKQYKLIVNDDLGTASKTNASNPYIILNQDGTNVNDKVRLSGGTNIDISNTLANNVNTITISFNNPGYLTSYTQMSSYLRVNYNGTDTTSKSNTTTYKDVYIVLNQGGTNREDKIKLVGDDGVSISNSYDGTNKINTITITGPNLSEYKKDHLTANLWVGWNGTGTPANPTTDVSNPCIILTEKEGSTYTIRDGIKLQGSGATTVKAKNGIVTINSTDHTYEDDNRLTQLTGANSNVFTIRPGANNQILSTTLVGSTTSAGWVNTPAWKTTDHDHTYSNGDTSLTFTPGSNETATVIVNTTWLEGFLTDNNYTINSDISGLVKEYLSGITGHAANKILKINSSNNDFEWVTPDSGGDITSTYLLSNVTGKGAGKVLKINSSNNGLVWANDEVGQSGSSDGNTTYSNGTGITLTGADADIDFGGNFSINTEWLDTYLNGKNYLTDHWVHYLRVNQGGANTIVGQQTSNTNTYLRLIENGSPVADKIQLSGGGTVSVSATSAGVITLSGKQYKLIVNDDLGTASKTNASNPYIILNQDGTNVNDKVRLSGGTNIDISNTLANNVNTITISFNNPGYLTSYTQMSSYLRVNYNGTDTTSKSNTTTYKDVYIVLNQGGTNREDKIKLVGDDGVSISNSYDGTNKINTITITGPNLSEYKKDHLTANLWVGWNGTGTPANPTTDVSNPCIILTEKEGSTYTIRDGIKLQGSGATTVKAKNGIVTINSTDHTYEDDNRLTQLTGANSNVFTIRPGANNQILSTTLVGSTTSAGWVNTPAWKTTDNDTKYQNETDDTSLIFGVNGTQTVNAWNAIKVNTTWLNTQIGNYITTNNIPTSDTNTRYKLVSVVSQDASTASKIPTIKLQSSTDGSTYSDQNTYKISGQNNVKVTSDSNGNIIIDGTHTHTFDHYNSYLYVGAKDGTANGTTNNTTDTYLLHVENGVNNSQVKLAGTNINISSNGGTLTLSGAAPYVIGSDNTKYDFFAAGNGYAAGDSKDSVNGATTLHLSGSDSTWDKVVISGQDGIEVGSNSAGNIILTGTYGLNVGKQSTSDPYPSIRLTTSNNVKDFITISGFNGISAGYGNTNLGLTIDETWFHDRMITANITYQSTLETLRQEIFAENGDAFHNKLYLVPSITNIQATSAGNYSMRTAILDNIYQAKIPGYKTYSAKTDGSDPVVTAYVTVMDEDYYNGIKTDGYRTIRDVVAKLLTNGAYRGDIDINQISGFANSKQNSTVSDSIYTTMSSTTLNGHAQSQMRYASESTVFKLEVNPWWLLDTLQTNIFKSFPDYSDNTEPVFSSVVRMNRHSLKSIDYQEYLNWSQDHGTVVGEYDGNPIIEYPHHGDMAFQGTHWTEVPQFYLSSYQLDNHGHHSLMIFPTWFGENMSAHLSNDSGLSCRSDLLTTTLQDNTIRHDYHYTHNFGIDANWVTNNCVKTQEVSSWIETTLSTIQGRVGKYTGTTTIALNYNTGDFLTGATINASRNTQLTVSNIPIGRGIIARFDFTAAAVGNKLRFGASNSDDYNILVVPEAGTYYIGFVRYNNSTNIQCIGVRKILGVKALS